MTGEPMQPAPAGDKGRTEPIGPKVPSRLPADDTHSFHPNTESAPTAQGLCPIPPADLLGHPRYQIVEYLGSGGMGTVYKALHRLMDRMVALKIINSELVDRPAMVARFRQEVRAAARLAHPNIVAAFDADQVGATHFLIMEFVAGVDLDQVCKERGQLPIAQACDYARQTALALQHAHERGMVHRDVKPHNLMLTPQGQIKVLDFGLARFVSEAATIPEATHSQLKTDPSHLLKGTSYSYTGAGTADYIAPEEAVNARQADIRADIYSLGCTLYRFLAGRVPFPNGDLMDKLQQHLESPPDPLDRVRPGLPARLGQVVERMMAKEPAARFQTPAEVSLALTPFVAVSESRILVVEDDPSARKALVQILEHQGYAVTQAENGSEALDCLQQMPPPSLILLDLMMPVMDGWELLRQLTADPALASIPVIVISAADPGQGRVAALGAAAYLSKPLEMDQLAGAVRSYTSGR
jgi:serine/threonine protein kinase